MFLLAMPTSFRVGDSAECRVNGRPARVTWRDERTLVLEPGGARDILLVGEAGDLVNFTCADAGKTARDYGYDGVTVFEVP
jgi:hypothetical protein